MPNEYPVHHVLHTNYRGLQQPIGTSRRTVLVGEAGPIQAASGVWVRDFPYGWIWDVKLEHKRDSHNVITSCAFTDSWDVFAEDVFLSIDDSIVFKLVGEDLMSFQVYNQHVFMKEWHEAVEYSSSDKEEDISSDDLSCLSDLGGSEDTCGHDCNIRLTGQKSSCTIPKRFVVYNRLDNLSEVEIVDLVGMVWKVEVETSSAKHMYNHLPVPQCPLRYRFKKGWRNFYMTNILGKGQCIHFDVSTKGTLISTIY